MAALKELKDRISTVRNTLKITSAMKLVASAKLHRLQSSMEALSAYEATFSEITAALCSDPDAGNLSPLTLEHVVREHALVILLASDNSMCGAFNANVFKEFDAAMQRLKSEGFEKITVYPLGEKAVRYAAKVGCECCTDYRKLISRPAYETVMQIADRFMQEYQTGRMDRVVLVYNHFRSMARQEALTEQLLPFTQESKANQGHESATDYIIEPDSDELMRNLLPQSIRTRLYRVLLDSITAENAARMVAMQTATDNAEELIDELSIEYNKRRQQAITEELSDIMYAAGG